MIRMMDNDGQMHSHAMVALKTNILGVLVTLGIDAVSS